MPTPSPAANWTAPPPTDAFWTALVNDSCAAVIVLDANGWIHYANPIALRFIGASTLDELKRLPIEQRLQHNMAEERLAIMREVIRTGEPRVFREMRKGRALVVTYRRFPDQPEFLFSAFRPADVPNWVSDADLPDVTISPIRHVDQGALAVLSEREKEILSLIGQGLTSAQIAKKLCRTIKTIEWHRSAIARKLHTKDRVALAQLAIQAGLCSPTFKVPVTKGRRTAPARASV